MSENTKKILISTAEGILAAIVPVIVAYVLKALPNLLSGTELVLATGIVNTIYDNLIKPQLPK